MGDFDKYSEIFKVYMSGMPYWTTNGFEMFNPVVFEEEENWTPVTDLINDVWESIDNCDRYKWADVFNMANTLCELYDIRHCSIVSKRLSVGGGNCLSFIFSRRPKNSAPLVEVAITEYKEIIVRDSMYGTLVGKTKFSFNNIISLFDTIEKMICDDEADNEINIELEKMCEKINDGIE